MSYRLYCLPHIYTHKYPTVPYCIGRLKLACLSYIIVSQRLAGWLAGWLFGLGQTTAWCPSLKTVRAARYDVVDSEIVVNYRMGLPFVAALRLDFCRISTSALRFLKFGHERPKRLTEARGLRSILHTQSKWIKYMNGTGSSGYWPECLLHLKA